MVSGGKSGTPNNPFNEHCIWEGTDSGLNISIGRGIYDTYVMSDIQSNRDNGYCLFWWGGGGHAITNFVEALLMRALSVMHFHIWIKARNLAQLPF